MWRRLTSLTLGGAWANAGSMSTVQGTLNLGGTFSTGNLGTFSAVVSTVNLTGTLNNTNATLALNAMTGSLILDGGTINGGTVSANGVVLWVYGNGGALSGVTVDGVLLMDNYYPVG